MITVSVWRRNVCVHCVLLAADFAPVTGLIEFPNTHAALTICWPWLKSCSLRCSYDWYIISETTVNQVRPTFMWHSSIYLCLFINLIDGLLCFHEKFQSNMKYSTRVGWNWAVANDYPQLSQGHQLPIKYINKSIIYVLRSFIITKGDNHTSLALINSFLPFYIKLSVSERHVHDIKLLAVFLQFYVCFYFYLLNLIGWYALLFSVGFLFTSKGIALNSFLCYS